MRNEKNGRMKERKAAGEGKKGNYWKQMKK